MIHFENCNSKDVNIVINNQPIGVLGTTGRISFDAKNGETITLLLTHTGESYGKLKKAHILIETTYEIQTEDGNEYSIRREKMRIEHDAYYDCFFLYRGDEKIHPVTYKVVGSEKIKKELIHNGVLWKFLEPLEDMVGDLVFAPIRTILVTVLIVAFLGWKWLFMIGLCMYALYFTGSCMGKGVAKFIGNLLGGKFKEESMEERLNRWMDSEYIVEFYAKPDRERELFPNEKY